MAKRIIYFGPFNNNKKEKLIEKSIRRLKNNEGDKFYYLLPNGELLTKYRRSFINRVEQTFEINLYTFDNIVKNILEDETHVDIDEAIKDMIIKEVIRDLTYSGKIKYYKEFTSMEGFAQSLIGIIGEIKRSLVYPEDYLNSSPDIPYYKEIGLIYQEYERYLKEHNLMDREASYFKAIEILRNSPSYFHGLDFIIIDEFYDFRPIEVAILEEICKSDIDIYINIPFDMKSRPSNIDKTINILKDLDFQLEYIEKEEKNFFENIGTNLFSHGEEKLNYNKDLTLIKSPSKYLEMKKIFEQIKKYHKEGLALNEISIVLLSDDYKDILFDVAREEKIPISLEEEKTLKELPLIKEFLNILKIKVDDFNKQSIINRLKSYYFEIVEDDHKNGLEFILRKLNFNHLDDLMNLLQGEKSLNITKDYIEPLKEISKDMKDEMSLVQEKDSIENYNNIFIEIIDGYELEDKIYDRFEKNKNYDLLHRDITSIEKLKKMMGSLEEIAEMVYEISIEDYFESLSRLFEESTIIEQDENINGVKILNPINSRGFKHEIVFITGLSQDNYPRLKDSNFFVNDDNYKNLKNIGLDTKNYYEKLNNEVVKFGSLLASCNNKLFLSYSEGVEGENISSIFLDEILNMISGEKLQDKVNFMNLDLGYLIKEDINTITTEEELSNYVILNEMKDISKESMDYVGIHNSIDEGKLEMINSKIYSEYKRNEDEFNHYSGKIDEDEIVEDIIKQNENRVYSNTYLEAYGKCPYSFLLNRVLKIEETERYFEEYSPMDIGNIYHEVLNHYYTSYKEDLEDHVKEIKEFKIKDTLEFLRQLVYKYGEEFGLDQENKSDLLILENTYDKIEGFIQEDLVRISNPSEKLVPYSFEVDFGKDEDFYIEIENDKIKLSGKIDRIDKLLEEDKYIIMDYKSSSYGIYNLDKIEEGISLQLPIYAMSQEDQARDVVAGLYGTLSDGKFQLTIGILDETKAVNKRHKGSLNSEEWTNLMDLTKNNIKDIKDNIFKADFSVDPQECSDYCIYKDICRYENRLEVE